MSLLSWGRQWRRDKRNRQISRLVGVNITVENVQLLIENASKPPLYHKFGVGTVDGRDAEFTPRGMLGAGSRVAAPHPVPSGLDFARPEDFKLRSA